MNPIRRSALRAILVAVALSSLAFAQGPVQHRINYSINVSHALRMGDYVLPAGNYVLYQVNQNDLNLFALYQNEMTHSPIAMIRTTRIEYRSTDTPGKARILLDIDESSSDAHPVLRGWNVPGMDGWEIISVVAKENGVLTRVK